MTMIETERLSLRPYESSDYDAVHVWASDPEVVTYFEWGPNTPAETQAYLEQAMAHEAEVPKRQFLFAVCRRGEAQPVGGIGLHISEPSHRSGWIGYVYRRDCWGQGYATEAARAVVRFGFEELNLHRIHATCDPRNLASRRVLEKCGMRYEGVLRQEKWYKNQWRDSALFAILEQEFAEA